MTPKLTYAPGRAEPAWMTQVPVLSFSDHRPAPQLAVGDVDLRPYCTDTHQGGVNACAGNATADAVEIMSAIAGWPPHELARMFVYALAKTLDQTLGVDEGTYIRSCFEVLSRFGIPTEADYAYDESKVLVSPPLLVMRKALGHKIHSYYQIKARGEYRSDEVLAALRAKQVVVFGTLITQAFVDGNVPTTAALGPPGEVTAGGHAMVIVGYRSDLDAFIVKNSWGPRWGDKGYWYMSRAYLESDVTWDLWVPLSGYLPLPEAALDAQPG